MKLHLPSTLTYYINLEKDKANNQRIKDILNKYKFSDWRRSPGFADTKKFNGVSLAHQNILSSLQDYDKPFCILEDDVEVAKFVRTISVPDNVDALYLGVSCMGGYNGTDERQVSAERKTKNIYRIYNMLAAHAIVYFNTDYVKEMLRVIEFCHKNNIPQDLGIVEVMKYWNVYGLNEPIFYQTGNYEKYTNLKIEDTEPVKSKYASIFLKGK